MTFRKALALLIIAAFIPALSSCSFLFSDVESDAPAGSSELLRYSDMPQEKGEFGFHDDEYGYHIVNKAEYVHPVGYAPNHVAHSYAVLDGTYQEVYQKMLDAVYCFSDKKGFYKGEYKMRPLLLNGTEYSNKDIEATLVAVLDDHPEIFWMASNVDITPDYQESVTSVIMNSVYKADEVVDMMQGLEAALEKLYDELSPGVSAYENEVYVYQYIINNCVYDEDAGSSDDYDNEHQSDYNLYGVLVDKKAVCEGYSRTFDYLCGELGIDAVCICGTTLDEDGEVSADGGLHMWNAVLLDGDWYMADATWDDWDDADELGDAFIYLNITTEVIECDHTIDKTYAQLSENEYGELGTYINNFVPPACTATKYCYYLREGTTVSSPDDADILADGMVKAAENESSSLMVNVDSDAYSAEQFGEALLEGSQPYFEAIGEANEKLGGRVLDGEADAVYYVYDERDLLLFELYYY